ncbi:MAG: hypothetical protein A3I66_22795 [Burkholderiales bacterium RIFCSPLOWO2_02_FULL_57_36]|nr:MAG: hypothetical protein A3I66_22795 [Burkholderiales bacterium RIFCSPLOWO2_02_FULL_57_36]
MFKNSALSSDLQSRKETLEAVGYSFESISKKSGWNWSHASDSSDGNVPTEGGVIQDAWRHAGERTQDILNIPPETWSRMGTREQKEMIEEAMAGK